MAEHCKEIRACSLSCHLLCSWTCSPAAAPALSSLQGYSCHNKLSNVRAGCHSLLLLKEVCTCTQLCAHSCSCVCVSRAWDIAAVSLCAEWVRTEGHYSVLPLHIAMGGREALFVLDMRLTWTMLISIFAISCSLEKEGK